MKNLYVSLMVSLLFIGGNSYSQTRKNNEPKIKWTTNPFNHQLFIENKGQFDALVKGNDKVLYGAMLGHVSAYFTSKGIIYQFAEYIKPDKDQAGYSPDPDANGPPKLVMHYFNMEWEGSSENVSIDASQQQTDYYTYPKGNKDTYIANIYKKITYHNIYPGIDVEYTFKANSQLEYTIIVHPGADLGKLQLKYGKSLGINKDGNGNGNVIIKNEIGALTESAPVAHYLEDNTQVSVSSVVNSPFETFNAGKTDVSKTLVIDPVITFTTNPNFSGKGNTDNAYDLDYDNAGNVYVYGSGPNPFQLVKLNSAGVIQWTFNSTLLSASTNFYGDFAVNKQSQSVYAIEGWNSGGGAHVIKLNYKGSVIGTTHANDSLQEMWRIVNTTCPPGLFVIFGGTPSHSGIGNAYQAVMLDTTMNNVLVPSNVLAPLVTNETNYDFALAATDPSGGFAYGATVQSLQWPKSSADNITVKCPVPALVPATYQTPDAFQFKELGSMLYDPNTVFNAMNGMACSPTWLYEYNGDTLKQLNKATGAIHKTTSVSTPLPYDCGGLDVDICENIYVANNRTIEVYDSSLVNTSSLPVLQDTIFDLAVGPYPSQLVYACGVGFVSAISLGTAINPVSITKIPANCSANNGQATATLSFCGTPAAGATYSWNNGQTNQTATGLSAGTYTVTVTIGCNQEFNNTVSITQSLGLTLTTDSVVAPCTTNLGSASVGVVGGTTPFTYSWSNGSTTSSTGPVAPGVCYSVTVMDKAGCSATVCITVTKAPPPVITVTASPDSICAGGSSALTASGGVAYVWNTGSTNSSITVNPGGNTTYTVVGTDANGCTATATVTVTIVPPPVITISKTKAICSGDSEVITVTSNPKGATYQWSGGSTATTSSIKVTPLVTTTYIVTGTNKYGCSDTASAKVIVFPVPSNLTFNIFACCDTTIYLGKSINLSTFADSASIYKWSPSTGLKPDTGKNVIASPTVTTIYKVIASNKGGCSDTGFVTVIVDIPCVKFIVPNVFTPNNSGTGTSLGSGLLDKEFYIRTDTLGHEVMNSFSIIIYDRWGKEMYKSTDPLEYWQGKTEGGSNASAGVYYYIISASCQGIAYKKTGFVQLIR